MKNKGGYVWVNNKKVVVISVGLLTVSVMILGLITFGVMREISAVENRIEELRDMKPELPSDLHVGKQSALVDSTTTEVMDAVVTVSAIEIGTEVIELQNVLGDLFCMDGNLPKDIIELRLEEGPKLGKRLSELTDIEEERYQYESWKLNKEWTLDLASVLPFEETDRIPVIFMLETSDGERVGIVKGTYDVNAHQIIDIEKHYPGISNNRLFQRIGGE